MPFITFLFNILKHRIMDEKIYQVLSVNKDRAVLVDLMTYAEANDYIQRILKDQPVSYFNEVSRVYVVNCKTGEVIKPHIKIYF